MGAVTSGSVWVPRDSQVVGTRVADDAEVMVEMGRAMNLTLRPAAARSRCSGYVG